MPYRPPSQHLRAVLRLLRVPQWGKNAFVLAALVFSGQALDARAWAAVAVAFAAFCMLSSATYALNDVVDAPYDRRHPRKRPRPVAAGQISPQAAVLVALICAALGVALCTRVNAALVAVGAAYLGLNLLYTLWLRRHVLVDVMCIALGFVLRAVAGGAAVRVPVSPWLLACTFTLCMFVGFSKRRGELAEMSAERQVTRPTLESYSLPLLDQLLAVSAGVTIVTYLLYTLDPATVARSGGPYLLLSVPLVVYGIFRFMMLVEAGKVSDPVDALVMDWPFVVTLLLYAAYAGAAVTWGARLRPYLETMVRGLLAG